MESLILIASIAVPFGLVAVVAYKMIKGKKKAPKLTLVESPDVKRIQNLSSRMSQLNAESQRDEDLDSSAVKVSAKSKKKSKKRKPSRKGKRK